MTNETPLSNSTNDRQGLPASVLVIASMGALLMGAGGVIALLRPGILLSAGAEVTESVRIYAGYLVSRNLAISAIILIAIAVRARVALTHFLLLAAIVQFLDSLVDCFEGRWQLVPGIAVIGAAFLVASIRVSRKTGRRLLS